MVVRDLQLSKNTGGAFNWLIKSRLIRASLFSPVAFAFCTLAGFGLSEILLIVAIAVCNSVYSLGQLQTTSTQSWPRQALLQLLNGLGFVASGGYCMFVGQLGVDGLLIAFLMAWLPVTIATSVIYLPRFNFRSSYVIVGSDNRAFPVALVANLITSNSLVIFVGLFDSHLVGQYVKIQQPALVFAPIALGLTSWLLPQFTRNSNAKTLHIMKKIIPLIPIFLLVGFGSGVLIGPTLAKLYGNQHLPLLPLELMTAAAGLGIATAIVTTGFVSLKHAEIASRLAIIQACLTPIELFFAVTTHQLLLMVLVELVIRLIGVSFVSVMTFRVSRDRETQA